MADGPELTELVRRAIEANTRFYQGWVNLSFEYFRGITEIFGGVQSAVSSAAGQTSSPASDAVVLEAEEGSTASGAFLVTNDLGRTLRCEIVASGFEGADGDAASVTVAFEPARFSLEPGEQRVVRATVPVDPALSAGVAYTGTFGIKGMEGFSVPVVLRKQHAVRVSPIERLDEADAPATGAKAAGGRKATAKKAAGGRKATAKKAAGRGKAADKAAVPNKAGRKRAATKSRPQASRKAGAAKKK